MRRVCWGSGGRKDFRRESENRVAATFLSGIAKAHSAIPLSMQTKKGREIDFGFSDAYFRLLRTTATAAITAMMTTAATAT